MHRLGLLGEGEAPSPPLGHWSAMERGRVWHLVALFSLIFGFVAGTLFCLAPPGLWA